MTHTPDFIKDLFGTLKQPKDKEAEYWLRNKYPGIFVPNEKEDEKTN